MIEIQGLHKSYGDKEILRGIDIDIPKGEVLALIGRSGCGKSSLLRCINFLEEYQAGEVKMDGEVLWYRQSSDGQRVRDAEGSIAKRRQRIGIVFQQYNLFPHLTALENVTLGPVYSQGRSQAEANEHAAEVLDRVGLADRRHAFPAHLSGGQQQRVAIARALAMRPEVLLLDEITAALDPELVGEVEDVIQSLISDEISMVMVTHSMSFARNSAHRVAYIADGKIAELGKAREVLDEPQSQGLRDFLRRTR
jgi:polar amino acid transport system ATP-binding protein